MNDVSKLGSESAAFWRDLAGQERALAVMDRKLLGSTAPSVAIHEDNAKACDARADSIIRNGRSRGSEGAAR